MKPHSQQSTYNIQTLWDQVWVTSNVSTHLFVQYRQKRRV